MTHKFTAYLILETWSNDDNVKECALGIFSERFPTTRHERSKNNICSSILEACSMLSYSDAIENLKKKINVRGLSYLYD